MRGFDKVLFWSYVFFISCSSIVFLFLDVKRVPIFGYICWVM